MSEPSGARGARKATSGRGLAILARLPRHFDAAHAREDGSPANLLGAVVDALARDLDELSTDLGKVRRAHRIGHADTVHDILALAGMHAMGAELFAPLWRRVAHITATIAALRAAATDDARRDAATAALAAWGLDLTAVVPTGAHPLGLWAPPAADGSLGTGDVAGAAARLATHLTDALSYRARLDLARTRVVRTAQIHADGNGTVAALMRATAAALDLEIDAATNRAVKQDLIARGTPAIHPGLVSDDFLHSRDRYWHVSYVRDRFRLSRPVLLPVPTGQPPPAPDPRPLAQRDDLVVLDDPFDRIAIGALARQLGLSLAELTAQATRILGTAPAPTTVFDARTAATVARALGRDTLSVLPTALDLLAIEENPVRRESSTPEPSPHAHRFAVVRRGFGAALLRIRVTGVGATTVSPMVVDRDAGHGVGFDGPVPDGAVLEFSEEGRVHLDGSDVTARAYAWRGACFADADALVGGKDFTLASGPGATGRKVARFVVTEPVGPPGALDRGAHFPTAGAAISTPAIGLNVTRFAYFVRVGHAGTKRSAAPPDIAVPRSRAALFDHSVWAASPETDGPIAGIVELSWLEHEAYAVRVVLPARLAVLDADVPADQALPALVRAAIERVRPVGVDVRVEYLDESWRLGDGILPGAADDPLSRVAGGTVLTPPP